MTRVDLGAAVLHPAHRGAATAIAEWDTLFTERADCEVPPDHAAATPRPSGRPRGRELVHELASREGAYCSSFTFTITMGAEPVHVDVSVDHAHLGVLVAFATRVGTGVSQ
ncbi:hypothetical protein ACH5AP_06870 [Streptomyces anulatus]